ncbi:hypothetical protein GCM10017788_46320 [Amycolatopsis acidiphila]|nr:hypothetical protein GCM10017788_46320 [Amycolatopsis acidiphila]
MTTKTKRRARNKPAVRSPLGRAGAFTPDAISVRPRALEVGGEWVSSFVITGYPREVHPGWLQPLLTYPGRVDVSLHIEPIDPVTAANRLRKQLSKLESGRRHTSDKGRLIDPQVEAATEDAYDLSARVARGEGKLYRLGLYLTVHASTEEALGDEVAAIRSLAASLLLDCKPTTYRSLQGWITSLPMGLDLVGMRRTFDTSALSAAYPFTSPDLPPPDSTSVGAPSGVLYGFNVGSQGLVHHDRFALDNHNSVILGRSGAGKSYLVKLELLRSLYRGIEIHVIDPEDEYARLAAAVGGTYVHLGAEQVRLNPMDLPIHTRPDGRRTAPRDALIRRSLFLHTVLSVLLGGELAPTERAALDRAITATYQRVGITADARTWTRPAPLLADLAEVLADSGDAAFWRHGPPRRLRAMARRRERSRVLFRIRLRHRRPDQARQQALRLPETRRRNRNHHTGAGVADQQPAGDHCTTSTRGHGVATGPTCASTGSDQRGRPPRRQRRERPCRSPMAAGCRHVATTNRPVAARRTRSLLAARQSSPAETIHPACPGTAGSTDGTGGA